MVSFLAVEVHEDPANRDRFARSHQSYYGHSKQVGQRFSLSRCHIAPRAPCVDAPVYQGLSFA